VGRTKCPSWATCGPLVWDPWSNTTKQEKQDHTFSASELNRPITACYYSCRAMLADWMLNRDILVDWLGRRHKVFKAGLSRLKRDVWYSYLELMLGLHLQTFFFTSRKRGNLSRTSDVVFSLNLDAPFKANTSNIFAARHAPEQSSKFTKLDYRLLQSCTVTSVGSNRCTTS